MAQDDDNLDTQRAASFQARGNQGRADALSLYLWLDRHWRQPEDRDVRGTIDGHR
jgi:hypothetical protein